MDGLVVFARLRQCAPPSNTSNPSPYPKWHLDRFSRFCAAYGRRSLYFTIVRHFPLRITLVHGDLDPGRLKGHMLPCSHLTQNPKRHLDRFSLFVQLTAEPESSESLLAYFAMDRHFPQNCPLKWDIWTLIRGSLGPPKTPESITQTTPRSVQPVLQGPRL